MAFLGKIGKTLGVGDLTHQPLKALGRIGATIGGFVLGGPAGAAAGNALGTVAVGDQEGSHSLRAAGINAAKAYGVSSAGSAAADYVSGAGGIGNAISGLPGAISNAAENLYDQAGNLISQGADAAKGALGFPSSTVAPAASAAGSAGQIALDPNLIDQVASGGAGGAGGAGAAAAGQGLTDVSLNTATGGSLGTAASGVAGAGGTAAAALPASTAPSGLFGSAGQFLKNNAGTIASLAPVAASVMQGNQVTNEQKALEAQAAQLGSQGSEMMADLRAGKLPQGMQQSFDQASQDAITSIRSKYASMGLAGSTMEQQEIASAQQRVESLKADQIQKLMSTGLDTIGASSNLYKDIMQQNIQSDNSLSAAIAAAVGSMGSAYQKGQGANG